MHGLICGKREGFNHAAPPPSQPARSPTGEVSLGLPRPGGDVGELWALDVAVGAAIAQISGEVDRVFALENGLTRESCLAQAEAEATENAVAAGASKSTIQVIEREDVPLAYLPGNATRIHVKVVGEMGAAHD